MHNEEVAIDIFHKITTWEKTTFTLPKSEVFNFDEVTSSYTTTLTEGFKNVVYSAAVNFDFQTLDTEVSTLFESNEYNGQFEVFIDNEDFTDTISNLVEEEENLVEEEEDQ